MYKEHGVYKYEQCESQTLIHILICIWLRCIVLKFRKMYLLGSHSPKQLLGNFWPIKDL